MLPRSYTWTGTHKFTTAEVVTIEIEGGAGAEWRADKYGTGFAGFRGRNAEGTIASPAAVATNRLLLFAGGHGHDGTTFAASADGSIAITAAENFTASAHGTYVSIQTTPIGTTTRAEVARFQDDGDLDITRGSLLVTGDSARIVGAALASIVNEGDGTLTYCTDCLKASDPCSGSSTGAFALRVNGAWQCL